MANLGFARWAVTPAERAIAIGVAHAELRALLWYRNADRLLEGTGGTVPDWVRNVRRRLQQRKSEHFNGSRLDERRRRPGGERRGWPR